MPAFSTACTKTACCFSRTHGTPAAAELASLGVRRLSAGSGIPEIMYGRIATLAADFQRTGVSAPLIEGALPYRDINALMAER